MLFACKGQISIFLCIILLGIVALSGVLVDASRIFTGEQQVRRAVAAAAKSALAEYNGKLKAEYGIFALSNNDHEVLKNMIELYLKRNLEAASYGHDADERHLDLYGFEVEDVNVTPLFNLSENPVVENQILEYMKYRAPKAVVEGIWERLSAVSEFGKMAGAYKRKMNIDKLLGKMDKYQQILKKSIHGGDGSQNYVNGFNQGGARDRLAWDIARLYGEYNSLAESLGEIEAQMAAYGNKETGKAQNGEKNKDKNDKGGNESGGGRDEENEEKYEDEDKEKDEEYMELTRERERIIAQLESLKTNISSLWNQLRQKETQDFIAPNARATESVKKIIELGKSAREAIKDLENYMNGNVNGDSEASRTFREEISGDIEALKNLILEGERAERILRDTSENERLLAEAVQRLDHIWGRLWSSGGESITESELERMLTQDLEGYNNRLEYDYSRPMKSGPAEDPRKDVGKKVKDELDKEESEDRDIEKAGISMDELPSRMKVNSPVFNESKGNGNVSSEGNGDVPEDGGSNPGQQGGESIANGDTGNGSMEVDFTDEDEKFSGNALGFLNSLGNALLDGLASLRDEIYIGEYIMGTFKNSVPVLKDEGGQKPDMDLRFIEKSKRDTFFQSEVEYILQGRSSERMNRIITQSQILMARFALNTLHVYTDARKKELAYGTATALAGWWTGGAGIPVIANLIMCSWGMGEALLDLKELMEGHRVPLYKSAGDWKLDIGIASGGNKTDSRLAFSYHDYLRLFLLLESREKKISRIEDLIELNMRKADSGFRAGQYNTYIRVEATVSMKYFFITGYFMPEGARTDEGRHKFRVVLYEGY